MPGNHHDSHDGGDHDHPDDHGHADGCGGSGDEDDGGDHGHPDDESLMIFLTRFADEIPTMRRAANIHSHLVELKQ